MEKTASEVLRAAKALIGTPEKWCKGPSVPRNGYPGCVMGAIGAAMTRDDKFVNPMGSKPHGYYFDAIGRHVGLWNDHQDTTHAMVMEAFDKAIALAEKDEPQRQPKESDSDWAARMVREVTTLGLTREKSEAR